MLNDREKLIELLNEAPTDYDGNRNVGVIADHLIANGVTVQRWIPVTGRLPDLVPCAGGRAYSEAVNVLTTGRKVMTAVWDGIDFICPMDYWCAWGEEITHWTPVLLPLPDAPKDGE